MSGVFTKRIKKLQDDFRALSFSIAKETKDGDLVIPKHAPVRKGTCPKCGKNHTINEHRFHGIESHLRTHGDESGVTVPTLGAGYSKRGAAFKLPPFPEPEARRRAASKKASPAPKNKTEKVDPWAKSRGDVMMIRGRGPVKKGK